MEKVIRDGKVAVLYSPGFGAGWYTWDAQGREELLFDPKIVEMVLAGRAGDKDLWKKTVIAIQDYAEATYPDFYVGSNASDLTVAWIPLGTEFIIEEYDGSEKIKLKQDIPWIKA